MENQVQLEKIELLRQEAEARKNDKRLSVAQQKYESPFSLKVGNPYTLSIGGITFLGHLKAIRKIKGVNYYDFWHPEYGLIKNISRNTHQFLFGYHIIKQVNCEAPDALKKASLYALLKLKNKCGYDDESPSCVFEGKSYTKEQILAVLKGKGHFTSKKEKQIIKKLKNELPNNCR